jgi:hypothetical protein
LYIHRTRDHRHVGLHHALAASRCGRYWSIVSRIEGIPVLSDAHACSHKCVAPATNLWASPGVPEFVWSRSMAAKPIRRCRSCCLHSVRSRLAVRRSPRPARGFGGLCYRIRITESIDVFGRGYWGFLIIQAGMIRSAFREDGRLA